MDWLLWATHETTSAGHLANAQQRVWRLLLLEQVESVGGVLVLSMHLSREPERSSRNCIPVDSRQHVLYWKEENDKSLFQSQFGRCSLLSCVESSYYFSGLAHVIWLQFQSPTACGGVICRWFMRCSGIIVLAWGPQAFALLSVAQTQAAVKRY